MLNPFIVKEKIENAFKEDNHYIDTTSDLLFDDKRQATAVMRAKQDGIICGVDVAKQCFKLIDNQLHIDILVKDGTYINTGCEIMKIKGSAKAILKAERIALNFIQRMSGIATLTHQYVKSLNNNRIKIVDTRKTTPNFRIFEKYSVMMGGGYNHRYNVTDAVMIKDNHIAVCGGIENAVLSIRKKLGHTIKIEVEVATLDQLKEALKAGVDIIMLDNMPTQMMREATEINQDKAILEVSGNITQERLSELSTLNINIISVGALTHSYRSMDISLKVEIE